MRGTATYPFLDALKAAEKSNTAYRSLSFPKLGYIYLEGGPSIPEPILVNMLLDILMERLERNAPIEVLRMDKSYNISPDDVERLEEYVDFEVELVSTLSDSEEDGDYDSDGNSW